MGTMTVKVILTTDSRALIKPEENHAELQILWANGRKTLEKGYDAPERIEEIDSLDERAMKSAYADAVKKVLELRFENENEFVQMILQGEFCEPYNTQKVIMSIKN